MTHSESKRMPDTKKRVKKGKRVAGQSVVATHKQVDYPVEKRRRKNKIKLRVKIGFQVDRTESA